MKKELYKRLQNNNIDIDLYKEYLHITWKDLEKLLNEEK